MLRRLPTPLTITPDDITALEDHIARRIAEIHYKRTGEDPEGYFTSTTKPNQENDTGSEKSVDPNDELKPLPGDRKDARERIMGTVPGQRGR